MQRQNYEKNLSHYCMTIFSFTRGSTCATSTSLATLVIRVALKSYKIVFFQIPLYDTVSDRAVIKNFDSINTHW